ncbi:MAG: hypothetical protein ACYC9Q_01220 [Bacillota bacterium]
MPEDDRNDRLSRGLTWTVSAARSLLDRLRREPQARTGGMAVAALVVVVVAVAAFSALRPSGPFYRRGAPPPGVIVAPATTTGTAAASAAAAVPGAGPVIVLTAGNAVFIGLEPARAQSGVEPRVAAAVRRVMGPWPSDEGRVNDNAGPAIAQVYVTAEAKAVDGLMAAGRRLLAREPLAAVIPDLVPLFIALNGLGPPAAPGR